MEFAIPGFVKKFCQPNAILTFLEYLEDYGKPESIKSGLKLIEKEMEKMPESEAKETLKDRIERVRQGERDLYF